MQKVKRVEKEPGATKGRRRQMALRRGSEAEPMSVRFLAHELRR
jgi:hypothetical protein